MIKASRTKSNYVELTCWRSLLTSSSLASKKIQIQMQIILKIY